MGTSFGTGADFYSNTVSCQTLKKGEAEKKKLISTSSGPVPERGFFFLASLHYFLKSKY